MELRNELLIDEFIEKYPRSEGPLKRWIQLVRVARWRNFPELRRSFPSADYVDPYVIFNIGSNKFRLVAVVVFSEERVTVIEVMTHEKYNRWKP